MKKKIKVNSKLIDKISSLSKLNFDARGKKKISSDFEKMLEFISIISKTDTKNILPLTHISEEVNVTRNDKVSNEVSKKDALKNSPQKDSDYFKVPTILKK